MNNIPYGYKQIDEKLVPDEYQAKVIYLMYELGLLKLTENDITVYLDEGEIKKVLNKCKVPKYQTDGYNLDDHWDEIINTGKQILKNKLKLKLEQLKEESQ